ncbi:MAG: hypothetical protein CW335_04765, partial [Clostridiales bacterium]|nr:hypothetical protein [Clostridiales bacterium]
VAMTASPSTMALDPVAQGSVTLTSVMEFPVFLMPHPVVRASRSVIANRIPIALFIIDLHVIVISVYHNTRLLFYVRTAESGGDGVDLSCFFINILYNPYNFNGFLIWFKNAQKSIFAFLGVILCLCDATVSILELLLITA